MSQEDSVISTAAGIKSKVEQLTGRLQHCVENLEMVSCSGQHFTREPAPVGQHQGQHQRHPSQHAAVQRSAAGERGADLLAQARTSATGAQPLPPHREGTRRRSSHASGASHEPENHHRESRGSASGGTDGKFGYGGLRRTAQQEEADEDEEDWADMPADPGADDSDENYHDEEQRGRSAMPGFMHQPMPVHGAPSDAPPPPNISVGAALQNLKASLSQQVQSSLSGKHTPTHGEQLKSQYKQAMSDNVQRRLLGRADNYHNTTSSLDASDSEGAGSGLQSGNLTRTRLMGALGSDNGGTVPGSPLRGASPAPTSRAAALLAGGGGSMARSAMRVSGTGSGAGDEDVRDAPQSAASSRRTSMDVQRPPPVPAPAPVPKPAAAPSPPPPIVPVPATGFKPPAGLTSPAVSSPLPAPVPATGFKMPMAASPAPAVAATSLSPAASFRSDAPALSPSPGSGGIGWKFGMDSGGSVNLGGPDTDGGGGKGEGGLSPFASGQSLQTSNSFAVAFEQGADVLLQPANNSGVVGFMPPASLTGVGSGSRPASGPQQATGFVPPASPGVGFMPPASTRSGSVTSESHYPTVGPSVVPPHYPSVGLSSGGLQPPPEPSGRSNSPPRADPRMVLNSYQSMQPSRPAATMPLRTVETVRLRTEPAAMQLPPGFALPPGLMGAAAAGGLGGGFGFGGGFGHGMGGGSSGVGFGTPSNLGQPPREQSRDSGNDSPETFSPMLGVQRPPPGRRRSDGSDNSDVTPIPPAGMSSTPSIPVGSFSFGINAAVFSSGPSMDSATAGGGGDEHSPAPAASSTSRHSLSQAAHALHGLQTVTEEDAASEDSPPKPVMGWKIGAVSEVESCAYAIDVTEEPPPPPPPSAVGFSPPPAFGFSPPPAQGSSLQPATASGPLSTLGWQPPPVATLPHVPVSPGAAVVPEHTSFRLSDGASMPGSDGGLRSDRGLQVEGREKLPWEDSTDDDEELQPAPLLRQSSSLRRLPPPIVAVSASGGMAPVSPGAVQLQPSPGAVTVMSSSLAPVQEADSEGRDSSVRLPKLQDDEVGAFPSYSENDVRPSLVLPAVNAASSSGQSAPPPTPAAVATLAAVAAPPAAANSSSQLQRQTSTLSSRSSGVVAATTPTGAHPPGDVSITITDADIARSGGVVPALLEIVRDRFRAKGMSNLAQFAAGSGTGSMAGGNSHGALGDEAHGAGTPQSAALAGETLARRIMARVDTFHSARRGGGPEDLVAALQSVAEHDEGGPRGVSEDGSSDRAVPVFRRTSTAASSGAAGASSAAGTSTGATAAAAVAAPGLSPTNSGSYAMLMAHSQQAAQQKVAATAIAAAAAAAAAAGGAQAAAITGVAPVTAASTVGMPPNLSRGPSIRIDSVRQALAPPIESPGAAASAASSHAATAATSAPVRAIRAPPAGGAAASLAHAQSAGTLTSSPPLEPYTSSSLSPRPAAVGTPSSPASTSKVETATQTVPPPVADGLPPALGTALDYFASTVVPVSGGTKGRPRNAAAEDERALPSDMPAVRTAADFFKGAANRATINTSAMAVPPRDTPAGISPAAGAAGVGAVAAASAPPGRVRTARDAMLNSSSATTPARPQRQSVSGRSGVASSGGGGVLTRAGSAGRRVSAAGRVVIDDEPVDLATYPSRSVSNRHVSAAASPGVAPSALRTSAHGGPGPSGPSDVGVDGLAKQQQLQLQHQALMQYQQQGYDRQALTREMLLHLAHMSPSRHPFETTTDEEREEEERRARRHARRTRSPPYPSTRGNGDSASAGQQQQPQQQPPTQPSSARRPAPAVGMASVPPVPWPRHQAANAPAGLALNPRISGGVEQLQARFDAEAAAAAGGRGFAAGGLPPRLADVLAAEAGLGPAAESPAVAAAPGDGIPVPPLSLDAPDMPEPGGGDTASAAGLSGVLLAGGGLSGSLPLPHETFFISSPRWRANDSDGLAGTGEVFLASGAGGKKAAGSGRGGAVSMLGRGRISATGGSGPEYTEDGGVSGVLAQRSRRSTTVTNTTSWTSSSDAEEAQLQGRHVDGVSGGGKGRRPDEAAGPRVQQSGGKQAAQLPVRSSAGARSSSSRGVNLERADTAGSGTAGGEHRPRLSATGRRRAAYWADEVSPLYGGPDAPYTDPDGLDREPSAASRGGAASPRGSSAAASVLSARRYVAVARAHRSVSEANSSKRLGAGAVLEGDDEDEEDEDEEAGGNARAGGADDVEEEDYDGPQDLQLDEEERQEQQPQQRRQAGTRAKPALAASRGDGAGAVGSQLRWGVADDEAGMGSTRAMASSSEHDEDEDGHEHSGRAPRDSTDSGGLTPDGTRVRQSLQRLLDMRAASATSPSRPAASSAKEQSPFAGRGPAPPSAAGTDSPAGLTGGSDGRSNSRSPSVTATAGGTTDADARDREQLLRRKGRAEGTSRTAAQPTATASAGATTSAVQRALLGNGAGAGAGNAHADGSADGASSDDAPPEDPHELVSPKYTQDMAEEEYGWDVATGDADVDNIASPRGRRPAAATTPRGGGSSRGRRGGRAARPPPPPLPYDPAEVPGAGTHDASPSYTRELEQEELRDTMAELIGSGGGGGGTREPPPPVMGTAAAVAAAVAALQADQEPSFSLSAPPAPGSRFGSAPGTAAAAVSAALAAAGSGSPAQHSPRGRHTVGGLPAAAAASTQSLTHTALASDGFNLALTNLLSGLGPVTLSSRASASSSSAAGMAGATSGGAGSASTPGKPIATQTSVGGPAVAVSTQTSLVAADSQQRQLLQGLQALEEQARRAAQATAALSTSASARGSPSASQPVADVAASEPDPELRRLLLAAWSKWYLRRLSADSGAGHERDSPAGGSAGGASDGQEAATEAATAAQARLQALTAALSNGGMDAREEDPSSSPRMQAAASASRLHMAFTRWLGAARSQRSAKAAARAPYQHAASSIPGLAVGANTNIAPPYPTSPSPAAPTYIGAFQHQHPQPGPGSLTYGSYLPTGTRQLAQPHAHQGSRAPAPAPSPPPVATSWPAALRTISSPPPQSAAAAAYQRAGMVAASAAGLRAGASPALPLASAGALSSGAGSVVGEALATNTPTVSRASGVRQVVSMLQAPGQAQPAHRHQPLATQAYTRVGYQGSAPAPPAAAAAAGAAAPVRRGGYPALGLLGTPAVPSAAAPAPGPASDLEAAVAQHLLASLVSGSGSGSDSVIVAGMQLATGRALLPATLASGTRGFALGGTLGGTPPAGGSTGGGLDARPRPASTGRLGPGASRPLAAASPAAAAGGAGGGGILGGRAAAAHSGLASSLGAHRPASPVAARRVPGATSSGADNIRLAPAANLGGLNLAYYGVGK